MAARSFAKIEPSFILADIRYKSLTAAAKVVYITLWVRAVSYRSDTLPNFYDTRAIQSDCSLDRRTICKSVTSLQQSCLIDVLPDGRYKVLGVKKIHDGLGWKNDEKEVTKRENKNPEKSRQSDREKRREDKDKELTPLPPSPKPARVSDYTEDFETWWAIAKPVFHPNSEKRATFRAWRKRYGKDFSMDEILEATEIYGEKLRQARKANKDYMAKHSSTFIGVDETWRSMLEEKDFVPKSEYANGF